jgi:positive regulator of sigma E activity
MPLIFMLLWDFVMPTVFGLKTITYLQAIALIIMANIIFKNRNLDKEKDKQMEEEKIKQDIIKIEEMFEKYKERLYKKD